MSKIICEQTFINTNKPHKMLKAIYLKRCCFPIRRSSKWGNGAVLWWVTFDKERKLWAQNSPKSDGPHMGKKAF